MRRYSYAKFWTFLWTTRYFTDEDIHVWNVKTSGIKVRRVAPGRRPGTLICRVSTGSLGLYRFIATARKYTFMILQPFYRLMKVP